MSEQRTTKKSTRKLTEAGEVPTERGNSNEVPSPKVLANLMKKVIAGRQRTAEAQNKLREVELSIRETSDNEQKNKVERLKTAALDEYRKARAEAERARRQLANTLKMLPSRSERREAEAA